MAKATITKIEFNQKLKDKWDGAYLYAQTEAGAKKKEFVFQKSDIFPILKSLEVGDIVDLIYVKNGEFFNLKDIKPTGDKSSPAPTPVAPTSSKGGGSSFVPRYSDTEEYIKHKDLMIIRQSTMKAAVDLVTAMLAKDMFKKTATPDFFCEEVGRIAYKFEQQVTGASGKAALVASVETLDTKGKVEYDDDCPFPE